MTNELNLLRTIHGLAADYLLANTNPDFARFCEKSPESMRTDLELAIDKYDEWVEERESFSADKEVEC